MICPGRNKKNALKARKAQTEMDKDQIIKYARNSEKSI